MCTRRNKHLRQASLQRVHHKAKYCFVIFSSPLPFHSESTPIQKGSNYTNKTEVVLKVIVCVTVIIIIIIIYVSIIMSLWTLYHCTL